MLEPVFEAMLEKAVRHLRRHFGNIFRWDGEALHLVATRNAPPAFAEARKPLDTSSRFDFAYWSHVARRKPRFTSPMLQNSSLRSNAIPMPLLP